MDADTKVKELEEEFKILKAEIRNVLLDIREVILENNNPLGDDHQGAFIRMDLNTTAQTMASNAAAHAVDEATHHTPQPEPHHEAQPEHVAETPAAPAAAEADPIAPVASAEQGLEEPVESNETPSEPAPTVIKKDFRSTVPESSESPIVSEIPAMYRIGGSLESVPRLSEWLGTALATIGPRELERVIAIERLWGNLPPNVMRALSYVQDLLKETDDAEPPWLHVMRDLDRLSAV